MFNSILFKNIEEMLFDYFSNYKKVIVPLPLRRASACQP